MSPGLPQQTIEASPVSAQVWTPPAVTAVKRPSGASVWPWVLSPQQRTEASARRAQVCAHPAETAVRVPVGCGRFGRGVLWPQQEGPLKTQRAGVPAAGADRREPSRRRVGLADVAVSVAVERAVSQHDLAQVTAADAMVEIPVEGNVDRSAGAVTPTVDRGVGAQPASVHGARADGDEDTAGILLASFPAVCRLEIVRRHVRVARIFQNDIEELGAGDGQVAEAPTGDAPAGAQGTGVPPTGGGGHDVERVEVRGCEASSFRFCGPRLPELLKVVLAPTLHRGVGPQSAGVGAADADSGERPGRGQGQAVVRAGVVAPAGHGLIGAHGAGVVPAGVDGGERVTGFPGRFVGGAVHAGRWRRGCDAGSQHEAVAAPARSAQACTSPTVTASKRPDGASAETPSASQQATRPPSTPIPQAIPAPTATASKRPRGVGRSTPPAPQHTTAPSARIPQANAPAATASKRPGGVASSTPSVPQQATRPPLTPIPQAIPSPTATPRNGPGGAGSMMTGFVLADSQQSMSREETDNSQMSSPEKTKIDPSIENDSKRPSGPPAHLRPVREQATTPIAPAAESVLPADQVACGRDRAQLPPRFVGESRDRTSPAGHPVIEHAQPAGEVGDSGDSPQADRRSGEEVFVVASPTGDVAVGAQPARAMTAGGERGELSPGCVGLAVGVVAPTVHSARRAQTAGVAPCRHRSRRTAPRAAAARLSSTPHLPAGALRGSPPARPLRNGH